MSDIPFASLDDGVAMAVPNRHSIKVQALAPETVQVDAAQNDCRLTFILSPEACKHLATLLLQAAESDATHDQNNN